MNNTNTLSKMDIYRELKEWAIRHASVIMLDDMKTVITPVTEYVENGIATFYSISVHGEDETGQWYMSGTYTLNEYGEER